MILQELAKFYDRLAADPTNDLPTHGYSTQKVTFVVVLRPDGILHAIEDVRQLDGKKKLARNMLLPGKTKPSGQGINPCLLWDNSTYLFGYKAPDPKKDPEAEAERQAKCFAGSVAAHNQLAQDCPTPETQAVATFLQKWNPTNIPADLKAVLDDAAAKSFGVFKIQGAESYVHEAPAIRTWWNTQQSSEEHVDEAKTDVCLVTGLAAPAALLHEPAIKGAGGQQAGTKLVSYNCPSFTSYAKDQGENAPVSKEAVFRYCNALNTLINSAKHRMRLGDMTLVLWSDAESSSFESTAIEALSDKNWKLEKKLEKQTAKISSFWKLVASGTPSPEDWQSFKASPGTRFYLLGLSPNAARLSVRFWQTGTLGEFATRLKEHSDAMAIVQQGPDEHPFYSDREHPPLWLLLAQTARDSDGIPPLLGGALLRAVLTGGPYPSAMAQLIINRIRADREINRLRAGFLKAYLTRLPNTPIYRPLPMSLDTTRTEPAYLLGRLFAVYEKNQHDASNGKLNSTIRDRYYSSASSTPRAVFGTLERLGGHHLDKLNPGLKIERKQLAQEIMWKLKVETAFPAHLNLAGQALFTLGYYHQTKALWTSKKDAAASAG